MIEDQLVVLQCFSDLMLYHGAHASNLQFRDQAHRQNIRPWQMLLQKLSG
jgi:hypothetical protein